MGMGPNRERGAARLRPVERGLRRELVSLRQECSKKALLSCFTGAGVTVGLLVAVSETVIALKPSGLLRLSFSALVRDVSSSPAVVFFFFGSQVGF